MGLILLYHASMADFIGFRQLNRALGKLHRSSITSPWKPSAFLDVLVGWWIDMLGTYATPRVQLSSGTPNPSIG